MKIFALLFFPLILGSAFLWHAALAPGIRLRPPERFGYATVASKQGVDLCVGSLGNCRLLYTRGDKHPRLTVCSSGNGSFHFCPYSPPKKEIRYAAAP